MSLSAEQIQSNWEVLLKVIDTYISEPRKEKLLEFYKKYESRLILMPASHKKEYHNAFPGGYVDHVLRVVRAALKVNKVWVELGVDTSTYTEEELVFSALNHDLGKLGDEENDAYIPQTDKWRKEKLGEDYKFNDALEFMSVPDRGLHLLTSHGVSYTKNEMLAIKLHDGLYDEANKPYLISWMPETKPRTSLVYILHQADLMAARIEFEKEWFPKIKGNNVENITTSVKKSTKNKALNSIQSKGLVESLKNF